MQFHDEEIKCCWCKESEELVEHIFLSCYWAWMVWCFVNVRVVLGDSEFNKCCDQAIGFFF